jgi:hypothetical protein
VIVLPCRVARLFFALLRRTAVARPRDAPPFVLLRQGSDGLSVSAWRGEVGLRWHRPGTSDPAAVAFTADHLAAFTGAADVTVTAIGPGRGEARWADRDGEHVRPLPTVEPDRVGLLPEPAGRTASLSASFLGAFGEAVRTAARDGGRFALTRILIRGRVGQVVATDGKQLLVQGGFVFPWADDVLVPAVPALAARELATEGAVAIGRSAGHVLVSVGPWTFALAVDRTGRFPQVEGAIPRGEAAAWCTFDRGEVPGLVAAIAELPGKDDPDAPVTLDLDDAVVIRAADGEGVKEVAAAKAFATGRTRAAFNRRYLIRALGLGLTTVEVFGDGKPVVARDETRTYVWAALAADAITSPRNPTPATNPNPKENPMPNPSPNGHPPPAKPPDGAAPDLLAEAEAVRDLLHDAAARVGRLVAALKHQKKHTRAIRQAVESLRGLPPFDT